MPTRLKISQETLDRLMDENIGKAEIGEDKLADKAHWGSTIQCLPTTVIRTKGLC